MNIKEKIANKSNYGGKRDLSTIKYIVIHYTGNDGDTDEGNGNYFANNIVKASAHYFVDSDSITRAVPDDCIAYHCGAKSYIHKSCRNANSIGIELCDDIKNGTIYPSEKTIATALELTRELVKKYNIPTANVLRHFDVTGKSCPAYWVNNNKWKQEFHNKLTVTEPQTLKPIDTINDIIWELENKKIITNAELWTEKCAEDVNVYYLCKKVANYLRGTL